MSGEGGEKENMLLKRNCRQDSRGKVVKVRSLKPSVKKVLEGKTIVTRNPQGNLPHASGKVQLKGEGKSSNSVGNLRQM